MGKPIVKTIIAIGVNEDNQLTVSGDLGNKIMCIMALTDAIKIVMMHDPSPVIVPPGVTP